MFRKTETSVNHRILLAVVGLLIVNVTAALVTIWVMLEIRKEQQIFLSLMRELPDEVSSSAQQLPGELKWQFWLSAVVLLNGMATAVALVLLLRAYLASQRSLNKVKVMASDILSSLDLGVLTTDLSGIITSVNPRCKALLSVTSDCLDRPLREIQQVGEKLSELSDGARRLRTAICDRDSEIKVNGHVLKIEMNGHVLHDVDGNATGTVVHLRDVTERVLIEEQMRRMERYMGLGSLAAGLHHEIKNPLSALSLHVQLLEERIGVDEAAGDVKQMLGVLKTEMTRVNGVLENFRNFASVSDLSPSSTNMMDLVSEVVRLVRPQAESQTVTFMVQQPDGVLPSISVDAGKVEQVLLNLIVNALEAMPHGGTLTVRAAVVKGVLQIEVGDTGPGIPPELRSHLFDPYFTSKSHGTGMGLALSEKIIRQHNGQIDFSTGTDGTVFKITLPINGES